MPCASIIHVFQIAYVRGLFNALYHFINRKFRFIANNYLFGQCQSHTEIAQEPIVETSSHESSPKSDGNNILDSQGSRSLRRRSSSVKERSHDNVVTDQSGPVKLDNAAQTHIAKHRYILNLPCIELRRSHDVKKRRTNWGCLYVKYFF